MFLVNLCRNLHVRHDLTDGTTATIIFFTHEKANLTDFIISQTYTRHAWRQRITGHNALLNLIVTQIYLFQRRRKPLKRNRSRFQRNERYPAFQDFAKGSACRSSHRSCSGSCSVLEGPSGEVECAAHSTVHISRWRGLSVLVGKTRNK